MTEIDRINPSRTPYLVSSHVSPTVLPHPTLLPRIHETVVWVWWDPDSKIPDVLDILETGVLCCRPVWSLGNDSVLRDLADLQAGGGPP